MLAWGWERALGSDTLITGDVRLVGAQEEPWEGGVDGWSAVGDALHDIQLQLENDWPGAQAA